MSSKKVVIINTSASTFKGGNTGVWLEELAAPYYVFKEGGLEVVVASIAGGPIPIDAGSLGDGFFTDAAKKFMHDGAAVGELCHSVKIDDIDFGAVDGVYLSGGHGCCTDFVDSPVLKAAIETVYAAGKPTAADCHGPIALAQCNKPDGTPLVAGGPCVAFSNAEEAAVGQTGNVPFLLEDKFKEQGGEYAAGADWNSTIAVAGNLFTGQNPQSSEELAKAVLAALA